MQRAAKRYDDDGHTKYIGLRPLLLSIVVAAKALPLQTSIRQTTKRLFYCISVHSENTRNSGSCEARWIRNSMVLSAYSNVKLKVQRCGV